jgi:hypothetical protein
VKHLILRLGTVLFAAGATYLVLLYCGMTDPLEAGAVQRDKIARLQSLPSPKIVIVGGSNVMFGIDSERIQRTTGIPVANMGVNAGISLNYMLQVVRPRIAGGDIVVLALEHSAFYEDPRELTDATMEVLVHDPNGPEYLRSIGGMGWERVGRLLRYNSKIIGFIDNRLRPLFPFLPQRIYRRTSFNELGDVVAHLKRAAQYPAVELGSDMRRGVAPESVRTLERFVADVRSRGGRVVLSWPSVMYSQYVHDRSAIDATFTVVQQSPTLRTTSSPKDYVFPDDYFYDTPWHLTASGRALRTEKLLKELASQAEKPGADRQADRDLLVQPLETSGP